MTDGEQDWLSARFAEHQGRLRAVAFQMLGSPGEAEDAVREAWRRAGRADAGDVENLAGWLTTVVARVCLNMLKARRSWPGDPAGIEPPDPASSGGRPAGPEDDETLLADSVGVALMVVLDTLTPAERLAFVLHDIFDVPFGEIADIIGRTPVRARQLAESARRRIQGTGTVPEEDLTGRQRLVSAFLAASRGGDFGVRRALLDEGAVLTADPAAVRMGVRPDIRGADAVADTLTGRAETTHLALVDGVPAAVWAPDGRPRAVYTFTTSGEKITAIGLTADPDRLSDLEIVFLSSR